LVLFPRWFGYTPGAFFPGKILFDFTPHLFLCEFPSDTFKQYRRTPEGPQHWIFLCWFERLGRCVKASFICPCLLHRVVSAFLFLWVSFRWYFRWTFMERIPRPSIIFPSPQFLPQERFFFAPLNVVFFFSSLAVCPTFLFAKSRFVRPSPLFCDTVFFPPPPPHI